MNPKKMQYRSKKTIKKQPGKKEIYLMSIIAIVLVISFSLYRAYMNNYNYLKKDIKEYLVYTSYTNNNTKYLKEVPYINMKNTNIETINNQIQLFANKYINIDKSILTYEYNINGEVLSLILKASNYENGKYPEIEFLSYNINLETETSLDNDTLLSYYELTSSYVESKIKYQLKEYYNDLVKEKYFATRECNYDCFLSTRGIKSYTKDVSYYIKDGKLYAYKPFYVVSIYGEENYFTEEHFIFEITE